MVSASVCALIVGTSAIVPMPAKAEGNLQQRVDGLEQELILLKRQLEAQAIHAQEAAQQAADRSKSNAVLKMKGPTPTFESQDGRNTMSLTGRVHFDAAIYDQASSFDNQAGTGATPVEPDLNSGTNFRRARIGVKGKIAGDWKYQFVIDGGGSGRSGPVGIDVAYLSYTGFKPLALTIGKHKAPSNFEEQTSSNDINFIERSFATNLATGPAAGKRPGIGAFAHGDRWYAAGGLYSSSETIEGSDEQLSVNGRIAFAPIKNDDMVLHIGANGWYMTDSGDGTRQVRFRDRPEIRVDSNRWIDARSAQSNFGNQTAYNFGVELAGAMGPFWAQGEWNNFGFSQSKNATTPGTQPGDAAFTSYYGAIGWVLTGERKKYSMSKAAWGGITPANPFDLHDGGWGAWEIALRYSYADLNDNASTFDPVTNDLLGVRGGEERNLTLGLNWYVNRNIRMMFNYINVDVDRLNGNSLGEGLQIGDSFGVYAMRMQVKW